MCPDTQASFSCLYDLAAMAAVVVVVEVVDVSVMSLSLRSGLVWSGRSFGGPTAQRFLHLINVPVPSPSPYMHSHRRPTVAHIYLVHLLHQPTQ
jgi:hypothetical protein